MPLRRRKSKGPSGVSVPTLLERERIPEEAIASVVHQIAEQFRPQKIILFGSYARRNPGPTSDVDLLVVMETPRREAEQAAPICQTTDYPFALDLHVRTPATLARRLELGDPFLREAVGNGRVLYEDADRRVGRESRG